MLSMSRMGMTRSHSLHIYDFIGNWHTLSNRLLLTIEIKRWFCWLSFQTSGGTLLYRVVLTWFFFFLIKTLLMANEWILCDFNTWKRIWTCCDPTSEQKGLGLLNIMPLGHLLFTSRISNVSSTQGVCMRTF